MTLHPFSAHSFSILECISGSAIKTSLLEENNPKNWQWVYCVSLFYHHCLSSCFRQTLALLISRLANPEATRCLRMTWVHWNWLTDWLICHVHCQSGRAEKDRERERETEKSKQRIWNSRVGLWQIYRFFKNIQLLENNRGDHCHQGLKIQLWI